MLQLRITHGLSRVLVHAHRRIPVDTHWHLVLSLGTAVAHPIDGHVHEGHYFAGELQSGCTAQAQCVDVIEAWRRHASSLQVVHQLRMGWNLRLWRQLRQGVLIINTLFLDHLIFHKFSKSLLGLNEGVESF